MYGLQDSDLEKIFETLDRETDGRISVHGLCRLLNRVGVSVSLEELEGIVGRKSLDLQEFLFFYRSISGREADDRDLKEAFKVFDQNNDGFISCVELESVLSNLGLWEKKNAWDCMTMICKFDANSDGLLDFQDFKNMMFSHYSFDSAAPS